MFELCSPCVISGILSRSNLWRPRRYSNTWQRWIKEYLCVRWRGIIIIIMIMVYFSHVQKVRVRCLSCSEIIRLLFIWAKYHSWAKTNGRTEQNSILYTPAEQPCSYWLDSEPLPLNGNESLPLLLRGKTRGQEVRKVQLQPQVDCDRHSVSSVFLWFC